MQKKSNNINFYDCSRIMNLLYLLNTNDIKFFSSKIDNIVKKDESYEVLLLAADGSTQKYVITFDGSFDAKVSHTFTNGNNTVVRDLLIVNGYAPVQQNKNLIIVVQNEDKTNDYYTKASSVSDLGTGRSYIMKR